MISTITEVTENKIGMPLPSSPQISPATGVITPKARLANARDLPMSRLRPAQTRVRMSTASRRAPGSLSPLATISSSCQLNVRSGGSGSSAMLTALLTAKKPKTRWCFRVRSAARPQSGGAAVRPTK